MHTIGIYLGIFYKIALTFRFSYIELLLNILTSLLQDFTMNLTWLIRDVSIRHYLCFYDVDYTSIKVTHFVLLQEFQSLSVTWNSVCLVSRCHYQIAGLRLNQCTRPEMKLQLSKIKKENREHCQSCLKRKHGWILTLTVREDNFILCGLWQAKRVWLIQSWSNSLCDILSYLWSHRVTQWLSDKMELCTNRPRRHRARY